MAKKSLGFGDDVEKLATLLRLDKVAKLVQNGDCTRCEQRKKRLNNPGLLVNKIFYND